MDILLKLYNFLFFNQRTAWESYEMKKQNYKCLQIYWNETHIKTPYPAVKYKQK
jgi:hypothetical protein